MKRIFFYIVGLSFFQAFLCEGAGIVAWKDQAFHEDSMAKIATYSRRKLSGNKGIFNVKGKDIYLRISIGTLIFPMAFLQNSLTRFNMRCSSSRNMRWAFFGNAFRSLQLFSIHGWSDCKNTRITMIPESVLSMASGWKNQPMSNSRPHRGRRETNDACKKNRREKRQN